MSTGTPRLGDSKFFISKFFICNRRSHSDAQSLVRVLSDKNGQPVATSFRDERKTRRAQTKGSRDSLSPTGLPQATSQKPFRVGGRGGRKTWALQRERTRDGERRGRVTDGLFLKPCARRSACGDVPGRGAAFEGGATAPEGLGPRALYAEHCGRKGPPRHVARDALAGETGVETEATARSREGNGRWKHWHGSRSLGGRRADGSERRCPGQSDEDTAGHAEPTRDPLHHSVRAADNFSKQV